MYVLEIVPVAEVETSLSKFGDVHPTDTAPVSAEVTVGWLVSLLHSRRFPVELWVYPLPVTATLSPPVRFVFGEMAKVPVTPVANAVLAKPHVETPATINAATTHRCLRPIPLRLPIRSATATTPPAP